MVIRLKINKLTYTQIDLSIRVTLILFFLLITSNVLDAQPNVQLPQPTTGKERTLKSLPKEAVISNDKNIKTKSTEKNGQKPVERPQTPVNKVNDNAKNVTYVNIENADSWHYDQEQNADAQVLVGNVIFSHEGVKLFCDSAYFYEASNSFDAYGNVLIQQGDTLFVYGDELYYDGNTKLARLRHNVLMDNLTATLETDSLNYDRAQNVGYYFDGGIIRDSLNELVSRTGHYYPSTNTAVFHKDVKLTNPKFVMTSDTLRYNTETKIATIVGPTIILYEEETKIYSEYGWYNTYNEQSKLLLNSYIDHTDGKRLYGDTIFYDKKNGKGECFKNVRLIDAKNSISLNGHYGYYIEKNERGVVTDSAVMVEYSSTDTLFLHADTLRTFAIPYKRDTLDTVTAFNDTVYKVFEGYNNVRFFRSNLQGVCDSTYFNTLDSVLILMDNPIVWAENRQISGDTIKVFQRSEKLDRIVIEGKAFATDSVENRFFNQLSGRRIVATVKNDSIRRIDVLGNAQSVYFMADDKDSTLIAMATTESSVMNIYIDKKNNPERIVITPSPVASAFPIDRIEEEKLYLANYTWQLSLRPVSKNDIFRQTKDNIVAKAVVEDKTTSGKKTTRREVKSGRAVENTKPATTSTTINRPSGFDNPSLGVGDNQGAIKRIK